MDSFINKFFKQSSHYLTGHILILLPRFISFPILTRVLSRKDYGTLSLLMVTLTLLTAFANLGLQHSAIRYYSDCKSQNPTAVSRYSSTLSFTTLMSGIVFSVLYLLSLRMGIFPESIINVNMIGIFTLIAFLIPLKSLMSLFTQFLRVEQRTKLLNSFNVVFRYVTMCLSLILLLNCVKSLNGFIFGMIIGNIIGIAVLYHIISKNFQITFAAFSPHFLRECLLFGLPLLFTEFGHTLLNLGDRYLIQYYLGLELLGIYSAGYNLTGYIGEAFVFAFRSSVTPIYLRIWANSGEEDTNLFLSDSLKFLLLILFPVGFGFTCVCKELILLLASQKYIEAYIIIPWVMAGFIIHGTRIILDAPLYIHKKSMTILILMFLSCVINIFINVLLIPKYGIIGAAIATFIANFFHIISIVIASNRFIVLRIEYFQIVKYLFSSIAMFVIVKNIFFDSLIITLITKILTGVVVYILFVLLLDSDIRYKTLNFIKNHAFID